MLLDLFSCFDDLGLGIFWVIPPLLCLFWQRSSPLLLQGSSLPSRGVLDLSAREFLMSAEVATGIFLFVICQCLMGLFPFILGLSAHFVFGFSLGLPLWLAGVFSGLMYNFKGALSHYTPQGAPSGLAPPLVLIEILSDFIRPLTISVRLTANMSAGHIVLGLLAGTMFSSYWLIGALVMTFYLIFEGAISLIQGYIFSTLIVLYLSDRS